MVKDRINAKIFFNVPFINKKTPFKINTINTGIIILNDWKGDVKLWKF